MEVLSATPLDPNSYSPDGRFLAYTILNSQTNRDVGVMPLVGDRKPFLLLQTANEVHGQISPDGRWIAYESDESGTYETYVQSFPKGGQKIRVSESGGLQPRWRRASSSFVTFALLRGSEGHQRGLRAALTLPVRLRTRAERRFFLWMRATRSAQIS